MRRRAFASGASSQTKASSAGAGPTTATTLSSVTHRAMSSAVGARCSRAPAEIVAAAMVVIGEEGAF